MSRSVGCVIAVRRCEPIAGTLKRQGASEDIRNYVQSYDAIIILRGGKTGTSFAPPLKNPFALSLSKGSPSFGMALKKRKALRQAQGERVVGLIAPTPPPPSARG